MPGLERDVGGTHLAINWPGSVDGTTVVSGQRTLDDARVQHALDYAVALALRLSRAGSPAQRIDIDLRRGRLGVPELLVRADVPGLSEAEFVSLARATLNTPAAWQPTPTSPTVLWARLSSPPDQTPQALATEQAPAGEEVAGAAMGEGGPLPYPAGRDEPRTATAGAPGARPGRSRGLRFFGKAVPPGFGKVFVALLAGGALGVLGLPRLDVALPQLPGQPQAQTSPSLDLATEVPQAAAVQAQTTPVVGQPSPTLTVAPTSVPLPVPSPTTPPTPVPPLFAARFVSALPNWPNNPDGNAWFGDGAFRLFTRQPGRFVSVGVPLAAPVGNAMVSAQFHKVGGAAGGGYGIIVLEVGDRGDVGIWQRSETHWIDIVPWTHADAVRPDQEPNTLAITLRDGALRFEVNGEVVASVIYNALPPSGGVGVFAGGDFNDVALEWLRIDTLHN